MPQEPNEPSREHTDVVVPLRGAGRPDGASPELDAIIVGGGSIGLACGWRAARRGLRVRVLERDQPGCGASSVAAGMLAPVGEANWGESGLIEMAIAAAGAWPAFASELAADSGLEVGYEACGALHLALDRDETDELRRRFDLMASLDLGVDWLRPRGCRALEPGLAPSCAAGVFAPREAAIDPRTLVTALAAAVEQRGGEVLADTDVIDAVIERGHLVGVRSADGREHRATRIVLATGAWSGTAPWLPPEARPPVRPVKGQTLTLRGSPELKPCNRIVATERVYLVPRPDGRLVVGATVEERGFDVQVTAGGVHELLREAYRVLPEISELELVEALAGLRPGTPDNAPLIGPSSLDGLLLATGHYRNGILMTPLTAEVIAAQLADQRLPATVEPAHPGRFAGQSGPRLTSAPELEEAPK